MQALAQPNGFTNFMHGFFGSTKKDARLEAKISSTQKEFLQKAAHLEGLDLSSFVISAAIQKARDVFQESSTLLLSDDDFKSFLQFLEQKHEPTEALKELMAMEPISER